MSSSLDDREPYEFFQDELDEYLFMYIKEKKIYKNEIKLLNQFIEYVCVDRGISTINELNTDVILDFIIQLKHGFAEVNKEEVSLTVGGFLNFISAYN